MTGSWFWDRVISVAGALLVRHGRGRGHLPVRADSGHYVGSLIRAVVEAGADFSTTMPQRAGVRAATAAIAEDAREPITYATPVFDDDTQTSISNSTRSTRSSRLCAAPREKRTSSG